MGRLNLASILTLDDSPGHARPPALDDAPNRYPDEPAPDDNGHEAPPAEPGLPALDAARRDPIGR